MLRETSASRASFSRGIFPRRRPCRKLGTHSGVSGIPLRLTVGDRGLKSGEIEFKPRAAEEAEMVKLEDVVDRAVAFVRA